MLPKLEGHNYKTHNVWEYNGGRKLTTLDMKVSKVSDFKPSSSAPPKRVFIPKVTKPITSSNSQSGSWITQTNRTERSPFNTSSSSKQRTIQQLVDDEQQNVWSIFVVLLKPTASKGQSSLWFCSRPLLFNGSRTFCFKQ